MEIGYIASELWRLRRWVAIGVLAGLLASMSVLYKLPSLDSKSFELGAASTEIIVEPANSPLGLLGNTQSAASLVTQAGLYASLLKVPPVKQIIGEKAGIPGAYIATSGQPTGQGGSRSGREIAAEQRGSELVAEANAYRILTSTRSDLPLITIYTQAPTAEEAIRLANAAVEGLSSVRRAGRDERERERATAPAAVGRRHGRSGDVARQRQGRGDGVHRRVRCLVPLRAGDGQAARRLA